MKTVGYSIAIVVLAVAMGAAIVFFIQKQDIATQPSQAARLQNPEVQINPADYEQEVSQIVSTYQANPTPRGAEDAYALLLGLRVPPQYQQLHLDLVLYFNAQSKTQQPDLQTLQQLAGGVDWL